MEHLWRLALVGLGGALGSMARYWVGAVMAARLGAAFPYGTITVNTLGSFLIVVIIHVSLTAPSTISADLRLFLTTGVLGGFTTYSSFNQETLKMLEQGDYLLGAGNTVLTVLGCLLAGALGMAVGRWLVPG